MITPHDAKALVNHQLGSTPKARHSYAVADLMHRLATITDGAPPLWQTVGFCHDLDYFETRNDPRQHGILAADWLHNDLPAEALDAIKAHDHRTGFQSNTTLASALKLADALALADEWAGRETTSALNTAQGWAQLRERLADRPYLPSIIERLSSHLQLSPAQLADLCNNPTSP